MNNEDQSFSSDLLDTIAEQLGAQPVAKGSATVRAAVSLSCSIGPDGANMDGTIAYHSGQVLRMRCTVGGEGLFAGGFATPILNVRPYAELVNAKLRVDARGAGGFPPPVSGGLVTLAPAISDLPAIPVAGAGLGFWKITGEMVLTQE